MVQARIVSIPSMGFRLQAPSELLQSLLPPDYLPGVGSLGAKLNIPYNYIYIYICTHVLCICIHTYRYAYVVCIYVCVYIYICVCIHMSEGLDTFPS